MTDDRLVAPPTGDPGPAATARCRPEAWSSDVVGIAAVVVAALVPLVGFPLAVYLEGMYRERDMVVPLIRRARLISGSLLVLAVLAMTVGYAAAVLPQL